MKIHFIGICGVAMSALAIAFHKQGHTVTGSDKGFYPPVSTHLEKVGILFYPGWHPDKMTAHGNPDLVIVGNVAGSENPEWQYVLEHQLQYQSYPEAIAQYLIRDNSIVCAGTYGKTTCSALLSWIFSECGKQPSYMFGGLLQHDFPAAAISSSTISIVEGDEYKTARWDEQAKFFHYRPTELLLTAVEWDHADVYPTEGLYKKAFQDLIDTVPKDGYILYSDDVPEDIREYIAGRPVNSTPYGKNSESQIQYTDLQMSLSGMQFVCLFNNERFEMGTSLLGEYMAKNISACFTLALRHGLQAADVQTAIRSFPGMKRRLEKRFNGNVTVFDDIAHSPAKASSTLATLRAVTPGKIYAIFEPNTGNRQPEAAGAYRNAFQDADEVIIPRLNVLKKDPTKNAPPWDERSLTAIIAESHPAAQSMTDDDALVQEVTHKAKRGDVIVFLGSHGFRGMIEAVCKRVS